MRILQTRNNLRQPDEICTLGCRRKDTPASDGFRTKRYCGARLNENVALTPIREYMAAMSVGDNYAKQPKKGSK